MIAMQNVTELFYGNEIVDMLVSKIEEAFDDFADIKQQYEEAMASLAAAVGQCHSFFVQDVQEAIQRKIESRLSFSVFSGFWANLKYYSDPIAQDFLKVDFDVFLQENAAMALPEYVSAESICDEFYARISVAQAAQYEKVIAYTSYLETIGPKLAHFFGYLLGNKILHRFIPGYRNSTTHTLRYQTLLEDYLGKNIDWSL